MDVPIKNNTNWIVDYFRSAYEEGFNKFPIKDFINELNLETLKKYDLKDEIQWLEKTMEDIGSPNVFSHIDFRGSNIMIVEPNDQIILCDFEYSTYGYRGFDFGSIAVEWNRQIDELFKTENILSKYPNDSQIKAILKPYVEESERIFGKKWSEDRINSMDQLVKEVKLFSMAAKMFKILFCVKNDEKDEKGFPINKKIMMVSLKIFVFYLYYLFFLFQQQMCERNYNGYWHLKGKFNKEKVFA
jgi:thiamine kinase-like enzyme